MDAVIFVSFFFQVILRGRKTGTKKDFIVYIFFQKIDWVDDFYHNHVGRIGNGGG